MRVECLAREHNTVSPARTRTRTARSGNKCTNQEDTAPPQGPLKEQQNEVVSELSIDHSNLFGPIILATRSRRSKQKSEDHDRETNT